MTTTTTTTPPPLKAAAATPGQQLLGEFCSALIASGRKPATVAAYFTDLSTWAAFLKGRMPDRMAQDEQLLAATADHGRNWQGLMVRTSYKPSTVSRKTTTLHAFGRWLVKAGHWPNNPLAQLRAERRIMPRPRTLSGADVDRLLRQIGQQQLRDARDVALVALALGTGVGADVLLRCGPRQVTIDAGGAGGVLELRGRQLCIPPTAARLLLEYLERRPAGDVSQDDSAALFANSAGARYTARGFRRNLREHARKAGLGHVSPMTLRHTFAALQLAGGMTPQYVAEAMGLRGTQALQRLRPPAAATVTLLAPPAGAVERTS